VRQHHAIEAGAPVRQFLADKLTVAELQSIRRQRNPELKRAVELAARGQPGQALELLEKQQRVSEIADAAARYQRIAVDYLHGHEAGQKTLVVSPGNDERRALNHEIRNLLVAHGHVEKQGRDHQILVRRDLTRAELGQARSYGEGDVIYFARGSKRQGVNKDSYLTVDSGDPARNSLTLRDGIRARIELSPARWRGIQVYNWEHRTLAVGDRLQFRIHDKRNRVANGEFTTVTELTATQAKLRFDSGRELSVNLSQLRHVDHGYASTSHAAQGTTLDRVILNVDSMRSPQLVNRKQFYVSISRARHDARVYTDDAQALRRAIARESQKAIALDVLKTRQTEHLQPTHETNSLRPDGSTPNIQQRPTVRRTL
jgi:ATP-dependent exoDNAse (exonuclease V) alpha subunit